MIIYILISSQATYLNISICIEEHDTDKRKHFLSDPVTRSGQVRKYFDHCTKLIQRNLQVSDQIYLPATQQPLLSILAVFFCWMHELINPIWHSFCHYNNLFYGPSLFHLVKRQNQSFVAEISC